MGLFMLHEHKYLKAEPLTERLIYQSVVRKTKYPQLIHASSKKRSVNIFVTRLGRVNRNVKFVVLKALKSCILSVFI